MTRKLLLFGSTGKMGTALAEVLGGSFEVKCLCSMDVDVTDLDAVAALVANMAPDVVVNAAARMGGDDCEINPSSTFRVNALFPRRLAVMSREMGYVLVHFSSDAVFSGGLGRPLLEDDEPDPVRVYGASKYAGEVLIRDVAVRYYIFRLPILFGESPNHPQFIEKLITRARAGERRFQVADDVINSPSYSLDIARALALALEEEWAYGLYHVANAGRVSLHELVCEIMAGLGLGVAVEPVPCESFLFKGTRNTFTPMLSVKIKPLRPWKEALGEYLSRISRTSTRRGV